MSLFIPIVLGSRRIGRKSSHVASLVAQALRRREGVTTILLDLAELDLPIMTKRMQEMADPPEALLTFHQRLVEADGVIIVAPEYKNSYPGVLKNALDYLEAGILNRKPVGIATVSSGGFGGLNCLAHLRLVCLAMGGVPIPAALPVARVLEAFGENGALIDDRLAAKLEDFLDEILWYTQALQCQRQRKASS